MEVLKKFHPRGPNSFREVVAIDTPDDHTAIFRLENPAPYMMRSLSAYESPMVPKHILEGQDVRNADIANEPIGTGPFKFVEWRKGQYIRMDRNENYWREGLPYLDRIVARFVPDASTRTAAMENGEVLYRRHSEHRCGPAARRARLRCDHRRLRHDQLDGADRVQYQGRAFRRPGDAPSDLERN